MPGLYKSYPPMLLDAGDAARNFDRFRAGQGLEVTIGQGDETAVGAEFHGLAGGQRQLRLAAAFRHDQRTGLSVLVDRAGGKGRATRCGKSDGDDERLPHFAISVFPHRLCCILQGIIAFACELI